MDNRVNELLRLLEGEYSDLAPDRVGLIGEYYSRLLVANAEQNLTRLIAPRDFLEGHLADVLELLKSGLVEFPALDLGSGAGVPGLLAAILAPTDWILCESEGRKAAFLSETSLALGLKGVQVYSGRAERYLSNHKIRSVVSRAVGPVERIFGWIWECSTWNNLVLLKGPRWEEEWKEFSQGRHRGRLKVLGEHRYSVGAEQKQRVIVKLARVPRGTE